MSGGYYIRSVRLNSNSNFCAALSKKNKAALSCFVISIAIVVAIVALTFVVPRNEAAGDPTTTQQPEPNSTSTESPKATPTNESTSKRTTTEATTEATTTINPDDGFCQNIHCTNTWNRFNKSISPENEPCVSFYNFACGKYKQGQDLTKGMFTVFDEIENKVQDFLKDPTHGPFIRKGSVAPLVFVKELFSKCIKRDENNSTLKELKNLVNSFNFSQSKEELFLNLTKKNLNFLFDVKVVPDPFNNSRHILRVDWPNLFNSYNSWERTENSAAYSNYIKNALNLTKGGNNNFAFQFEYKMCRCDVKNSPNRVALGQLSDVSGINLTDVIKRLVPGIQSEELIMIPDMDYLTALFDLIKLPTNHFIDYSKWRIIQTLGPVINSELAEIEFEYNKRVYGAKAKMTPQAKCFELLLDLVPDLMGHFYVEKIIKNSEEEETKLKNLLKNINETYVRGISETFEKEIKNSSWMDEEAKIAALKKLASLKINLGYPELSEDEIEKKYPNLSMDDKEDWTALQLINYLKEQVMSIELAKYKEEVNFFEWKVSPASAKVNYDPVRHSITIPLALLKEDILYMAERPEYINFAMIGSIIGQLFSRMFDRSSIDYWPNGTLVTGPDGQLKSWLSPNSTMKFSEMQNLFVSMFETIDSNLKPNQTMDSVLADMGGIIHSANTALNSSINQTKINFRGMSQKKLFFIAYANTFCAQITEQHTKQLELNGALPPRHRLDGPLYNFVEYLNEFKCEKDTKMGEWPTKPRIW